MKIRAERKEIVWTLTLSDAEMASIYTLLHEAYDPVTARGAYVKVEFKEVREQTLLEHRQNIGKFLRAFNEESDRMGEYTSGG